MNVKNVISKAKTNFKTKFVPAAISAGTAVSAVVISASAESGTNAGSVNYSDVGTKLIAGFNDIISGCVDVAVAVIPLGLGLYGLGLVWNTAKKFFTKATK